MAEPNLQRPHADLLEEAFRPAKRRKFYRKRAEDDEPENTATAAAETVPSVTPLTLDELVIARGVVPDVEAQEVGSTVSVANIIRQRKAIQRKRAGIEFRNTTNAPQSGSATPSLSKVLTGKDEAAADIEAVVNRFAVQTGQVADVDKHM